MQQRKLKSKVCRACGDKFIPWNSTQQVCNTVCAIEYQDRKKDKELQRDIKQADKIKRKDIRKRKEKLKSKRDWHRECQTVFNKFIRLRDNDEPCISCQRHHTGQYHAGHYLTSKAHPEIRYNEFNVNKQCRPCNEFLSGDIANYRINLIAKIGQKNVDILEGPHKPLKFDISDIKEKIAVYKLKIKQLEV